MRRAGEWRWSALLLNALVIAPMALVASQSQTPEASGCAGRDGTEIGRLQRDDPEVFHVGPLLGRWTSPAGALSLQIVLRPVRDTFFDSLLGTWRGTNGETASTARATYDATTRVLALEFQRNQKPPGFSRLRLEAGGESLVVIDEPDADAGVARLTREVRHTTVPFDRMALARAGAAAVTIDGATARVTTAAGTRGWGRLTAEVTLPEYYDVELTFRSTGLRPGSFICLGVVSHDPQHWNPYRYVMAGHVRRPESGSFTMQTFDRGEIRRFTAVRADGAGGRLRLRSEHLRVFALFHAGKDWTPVGTQPTILWDDLRLVVAFGNDAIRGTYPAMDVVLSDLRILSR